MKPSLWRVAITEVEVTEVTEVAEAADVIVGSFLK
jgi:hypothetical protein